MKRIHREEEYEHENSERWLLTYSDLITLLLALFIIMYAISNVDKEKLTKLSEALTETFHGDQAGISDILPPAGVDSNAEAINNALNKAMSEAIDEEGNIDDIYTELKKYIEENHLEDKIELQNTSTYIRVSLKDVFLFVPDSYVMLDQSKPVLIKIEAVLEKLYPKIDHITISGHTADPANDGPKSSAIAWQLSTERAVTVLNFLAGNGLPQYKLSIEGHSHFEPIASNATEEGRAKNRRVEITIFKQLPAAVSTEGNNAEQEDTSDTDTDKDTKEKEKKGKH